MKVQTAAPAGESVVSAHGGGVTGVAPRLVEVEGHKNEAVPINVQFRLVLFFCCCCLFFSVFLLSFCLVSNVRN